MNPFRFPFFVLILAVSFGTSGCNHPSEKELFWMDSLQGEWFLVGMKLSARPEVVLPPLPPQLNLDFQGDSVYFPFEYLTIRRDYLPEGNDSLLEFSLNDFHPLVGKYRYSLQDDSLNIYIRKTGNLALQWKLYEIRSDTLEVSFGDMSHFLFKRVMPVLDSAPEFDRIILYNSGCFGPCSIQFISLDTSGWALKDEVEFSSERNTFSFKLAPATTKAIFYAFKRANLCSLSPVYRAKHPDDQAITVTGVQHGKPFCTVYDYGMAGPGYLLQAYQLMRSATETLHPKDSGDQSANSSGFSSSGHPHLPPLNFAIKGFEKKDSIIELRETEYYDLLMRLKNSPLVNERFEPAYTISFSSSVLSVQDELDPSSLPIWTPTATDGRYFTFSKTDKNPVTFDLGYDFIEMYLSRSRWVKKQVR